MKKSAIEQNEQFVCEECGEEVYTCDNCEDYFVLGGAVWCDSSKHYCNSCGTDDSHNNDNHNKSA